MYNTVFNSLHILLGTSCIRGKPGQCKKLLKSLPGCPAGICGPTRRTTWSPCSCQGACTAWARMWYPALQCPATAQWHAWCSLSRFSSSPSSPVCDRGVTAPGAPYPQDGATLVWLFATLPPPLQIWTHWPICAQETKITPMIWHFYIFFLKYKSTRGGETGLKQRLIRYQLYWEAVPEWGGSRTERFELSSFPGKG